MIKQWDERTVLRLLDDDWKSAEIKDSDRFTEILGELRKLPEHSDVITAYGSGAEVLDSYGVLGEFAEAIYAEDILDESDLANVYYQLFSIDFQNSYEGIDTFYDNFYEGNGGLGR